jgi:hypothetical protein
MNVLAIRLCTVSPEAAALAGFFGAPGVPQRDLTGILPAPADGASGGAIFFLKAPGGLPVSFQSALPAHVV